MASPPQADGQLCVLRSNDLDSSEAPRLQKIELLLDSLQEPLSVVHTVDPRDAEQNCAKWMPPIHKEIGVIADEVCSGGWLRRKEVKVVLPSKFVLTVNPPHRKTFFTPPERARPTSSAKLVWLLVATTHQEQGQRFTPQVLQLRHSGVLWSSALRGVGC